MKTAYRVLAWAVPVLVAIQAMAIALGFFGVDHWVDHHDYTKTIAENGNATGAYGLAIHAIGALVIALVALLLLIVSFFARVEGGVVLAALIVLDVILQWALAFAGFAVPVIGALHGLNAFVLFGLGMMAAMRVGRVSESAGAGVA